MPPPPANTTTGSDLDTAQTARDVVYMRQLGRTLGWLGSWPGLAEKSSKMESFHNRIRRAWFLFLAGGLVTPSNLASLIVNYRAGSDVRRLGHIVLTCLINAVGMTKTLLFSTRMYWVLVDKFLNDIHLFNHKHRNEYFLKEQMLVDARCLTLWRTMVVILYTGVFLYNAQPWYVNYASGAYSGADVDYEYSVYFVVPGFDPKRELGTHCVLNVINMCISLWCVSMIWLPDLLAMMAVLHIGGHMHVLQHEMQRFTDDISELAGDRSILNEQESVGVRGNLKYFIDTHRNILSYVLVTNQTFSGVYFCYFTYFQVALCIMMWECSQGTEGLVQYGILTGSSVFSLTLLCIVMEMIATENDALERSVYALPWHLMRVPERRTVLIMLMRVQSPLRMKALGLTDIGVSTMAAIMKTSVSYFMFLSSKA